jgi:hypothetical protein
LASVPELAEKLARNDRRTGRCLTAHSESYQTAAHQPRLFSAARFRAELSKKLGAHHYVDSSVTDIAKALQERGGAQVVLALPRAARQSPPPWGIDIPHISRLCAVWGVDGASEIMYSTEPRLARFLGMAQSTSKGTN